MPLSLLRDLRTACVFLTRLPLRVEGRLGMHALTATVHLFPVVGAFIALCGGLVYALAAVVGLASMPAALFALAAMILITGALHEDGLADTADALQAGGDRERGLEIMRDSRIGSYGVIALVLVLFGRLLALASFWDPLLVTGAAVAAASFSRATMPVVMLVQKSAREQGLAAGAGRPSRAKVVAGLAIAVLICLVAVPSWSGLLAMPIAGLAAALVAIFLGRRFGGCTGDTLGAVQQLAEVTFLMALVGGL